MVHEFQKGVAPAVVAVAVVVSLAILAVVASTTASANGPTCSGTLDIANHGEHVVGDYVIGSDGTGPGGGEGAEVPGGPGPGFHFPNEVAPGASFCLSQSQSPGAHPGP